jgi:DNA-binding transcriptional LysR family regulator
VNVSALDVRLLVVFDALMSERHVTRAATRLRLSQPAISNALRRLREIFDDELFQRTADGMMPTPRAMELGIPLAQVLRQLENAMQPPSFVPEQAERTFRLAVSPPVTTVLVPRLVERVLAQAPGIDLRVQSTPGMRASSLLDSQAADLVIGAFRTIPRRFPVQLLYRERYAALMRAGHPLAGTDLELPRFASAEHLLVTQTVQTQNLFDDAIGRLGLQRRIRLTLTDWMVAGQTLATTDLVTAVFQRTAAEVAAGSAGAVVALPLPLPPVDVVIIWHPTFSRHPAYEWLIGAIRAVAQGPTGACANG